jgi:hypothetical protein
VQNHPPAFQIFRCICSDVGGGGRVEGSVGAPSFVAWSACRLLQPCTNALSPTQPLARRSFTSSYQPIHISVCFAQILLSFVALGLKST